MLYALVAFLGVVLGYILSFVSRNEQILSERKEKQKEIPEKSEEDKKIEKKIAEQWDHLLNYNGGQK